MGIESATTWTHVADITNLLYENPNIKLFVEIGANFCGFAALLVARTIIFPDFGYLGIEQEVNRKSPTLEAFMADKPRCHIIWSDCFSYGVKKTVKKWIDATTHGFALVWCDGDNKPEELRQYAPLLRPKDYLMIHDYSGEERLAATMACRADVEPFITKGLFKEATPSHWSQGSMQFLMRKIKDDSREDLIGQTGTGTWLKPESFVS